MTVHTNSRQAFASLDVGARQAAVLALFANGAVLADRECAEALGWELYTTRPRLTECVKRGLLVEVGSAFDPITGRKVRICALAPLKAPSGVG